MQHSLWGESTQYFYSLTPDRIADSVTSQGMVPTGRTIALNGLENRIYEVEVEEDSYDPPQGPFSENKVVVKFYRPGRWNREMIQEEHDFLRELGRGQVSVVPPLTPLLQDEENQLFYCIFPKVMGRLQDEFSVQQAQELGHMLRKMHSLGSLKKFQHRYQFSADTLIAAALPVLQQLPQQLPQLSSYLIDIYITLAQKIFEVAQTTLRPLPGQRLHGDLHLGNVLWSKGGPWIIDFDDCMTGPVQQDLWVMFPGRDEYSLQMRGEFLRGYFQDSTGGSSSNSVPLSNSLVEVLRSMRMIHFNGWIARRFQDPAFSHTFTQFATIQYWEQQVLDLKEQVFYINQ